MIIAEANGAELWHAHIKPRPYLCGKQPGQFLAIFCLLGSHSELSSLPCSLNKVFLPCKGCFPPQCSEFLSFFALLQPLPPQVCIWGPCQSETCYSAQSAAAKGSRAKPCQMRLITALLYLAAACSIQYSMCMCCCAHVVAGTERSPAYTFHRALETLFSFGMLRSAAAVFCKPPLLCRVE